MVINFSVKGQLDFTNINYVIVFNTCGVGGEPYPNGCATTYTNYSYALASVRSTATTSRCRP